MPDAQSAVLGLQTAADVGLLAIGVMLALLAQGGFALLDAGSARQKNQADALCRIAVGFAVSVVAYVFVGYAIAYGARLLVGARELGAAQGLTLARLAVLAALAATVPAIVAGGIAERSRLLPHCVAAALIAGLVYPFLEGLVWGRSTGLQAAFHNRLGAVFHDFAGSVVVHAMGGWLAFAAVRRLGPRLGRYDAAATTPPSSLPLVALGTWLLSAGWLGLTVLGAQSGASVGGLVAANALMAVCGGILASLIAGDGDPRVIHNGALAGLVAVCAGADVMHPVGALLVGGVAGIITLAAVQAAAEPKWHLDDVRGVWALHGLCGVWGGIACGIFGLTTFGGMGGVSFWAQLLGSLAGAAYALVAGSIVYWGVDILLGLRLAAEDERRGADLALHKGAAAGTIE